MLQPILRFFGFSTLRKMRLIVPLVVVCGMAGTGSQVVQAQVLPPPPVGTFVYVTNSNAGTVSVIDTSTNTVVATILLPPPSSCIEGCAARSPAGLAVTPGGKFVYVANQGNGTLSVIDASTNTVSATISLPTFCAGCLANPVGVAITPDGSRVYVTDVGQNLIDVISTATNAVVFPPTNEEGDVSSLNGPIAITPDGTAAFYTFGSGSVGRFDTNPASEFYNTHTNTLTVGTNPLGIAITPNGASIYVANNAIMVGDVTQPNQGTTVSVIPNTPNAVLPAMPFSPITTVVLPAGSGPGSIAITPDGKSAYVVDQGNSTVSVITTATNTLATTISSGFCGSGTLNQIAITSDGTKAYVADALVPDPCNTADVINIPSNTVTPTVSVGSRPFGVAASASQTKTLGPPGTTTIFTFNTDTYKLTGVTNTGGEQVTVEALLVPASQFPTFPSFPNETCIPYGDYSSGGVDMCVEFQVHCLEPGPPPSTCNFVYEVATGYDLPSDLSGGIGGPDFLVAHGVDGPLTSDSNVQSIFLSYQPDIKDPTSRGGSKGPSVFVATRTKNASPITTGVGFVGWGLPVVNADLNRVKAGATRPLSFFYYDSSGNPVLDLAYCNTPSGTPAVCSDPVMTATPANPWINIVPVGIPCPNPNGGSPINTGTDISISTAGASGFQNNGNGAYQANWKTMKSWQGSCANVQVTFSIGSSVANGVLFPANLGFQFN